MVSFWDQGHQWQPRWRWGMGLQDVTASHVRPPATPVLSFQWEHRVLTQSCHLLLSHAERQKLNLSDVVFPWVSGGSPGLIPLNPESLCIKSERGHLLQFWSFLLVGIQKQVQHCPSSPYRVALNISSCYPPQLYSLWTTQSLELASIKAYFPKHFGCLKRLNIKRWHSGTCIEN